MRSRIAVLVVLAGLPSVGCDRRTPPAPDANVLPPSQFVWNTVAPIFAGQTPVLFNASGSLDTDGNIAAYSWNFGDNTPVVESGATVLHVFPNTALRCQIASCNVLRRSRTTPAARTRSRTWST